MNRESTLSSTGYGYDEGLRKFMLNMFNPYCSWTSSEWYCSILNICKWINLLH